MDHLEVLLVHSKLTFSLILVNANNQSSDSTEAQLPVSGVVSADHVDIGLSVRQRSTSPG